ncbi:putative surface anchored protein (pseudogene) [Streptococcus pneumoniae]|nr:putative surface anchored protein (pseudogene) [Streptococcus pneumoniae]
MICPVLILFYYKVEVGGDGTATIVFKDGSAITIPGNQLVAQDPKAQDSTKPTAEKSTVKAPAQRVDVKDITHLTDEEKEKVKVAILQANGSALDGATINVAGYGTATITFPDGSVVTILGKDTVQQSAKGESVTQEATPEYKLETTPGGDKGGNTGSSDANANEGGGSQAGGSAQSQASKQLATEKESAKNAIEKAAKDKQDEIKGAPLSDKEKAELLARVEAEKQAALKEIENAKTMEDVKEAETIGVQAIVMVTVPKRPVAPNAAPKTTSTPQATAGTMQDVTYQSPAGKQLPNTGSASSAALASLALAAATSGFALLGRKTRRRK